MAKKIDINGLDYFKGQENEQIAPVESSSTASRGYAVGEYFWFKGKLCIATDAIAQGGTITLNTNCKNAKLADDLVSQSEKIAIIDDEVQVSNLFDITTSQFNTRMVSGGTISNTKGYILSDYIDVSDYKTLYFSQSTGVVELLDSTKTRIRITTSVTTLDLTLSANAGTKYIRVSVTSIVANSLTISDKSVTGLTKVYGYETEKPIVNASVTDKISSWYNNTFNTDENVLANSSVTTVGTCSYKVYDNTCGYGFAYKCISNTDNTIDFRPTLPSAVSLIGVQAFEIVCFIENLANISSLILSIGNPSATTYSRSINASTLKNGWNRILINTAQQDTLTASTWSTFTAYRLVVQGTGSYTVTFAAINLQRRETAKLIFVDDHGYHGFKTLAYPLLKAAGQPVTWALNPGRLGTVISTHESILTQEDIEELAPDAYSEFSFHNWNPSGNPTETMTPDELRQDFQKCITYLKQNGICPTHIWRAAYTQNSADNWWVAQDMVEATATHTDGASYSLLPFANPYNINRLSIQGRSQADIDDVFTRLKLTHTTMVLYTHGCVEERDPDISSDSLHCTVDEVQYLCTKIATGISEGWLEPTTYNRLATLLAHDSYSVLPNPT